MKMSKTKTESEEQEVVATEEVTPVAPPTTENGTPVSSVTILEAPTREALQEQFEAIKAEAPEGASIVTGAVGQKPDNRTFVLQVSINH